MRSAPEATLHPIHKSDESHRPPPQPLALQGGPSRGATQTGRPPFFDAMCNSTEYTPHREHLPRRYCAECKALLSTGNTTRTCWSCDPRWGRYNVLWAQDFGDALARLMET